MKPFPAPPPSSSSSLVGRAGKAAAASSRPLAFSSSRSSSASVSCFSASLPSVSSPSSVSASTAAPAGAAAAAPSANLRSLRLARAGSFRSTRGGADAAATTRATPPSSAAQGRGDDDGGDGANDEADAFEPLSEEEQAALDLEAASFAAELEDADLAMSDAAVTGADDEDVDDFEEDDDGSATTAATDELLSPPSSSETTAQQEKPSRPTPLRRLPRLVILGRPNVGKSALFNRLVGDGRAAVVADFAGVTRDALFSRARWRGREFAVVDTGGLMAAGAAEEAAAAAASAARTSKEKKRASAAASEAAAAAAVAASSGEGHLPAAVEAAAAAAAAEADALLVVVDGSTGLTAADLDVIQWARSKSGKRKKRGGGDEGKSPVPPSLPLLLAVNKCDNSARAAAAVADAWQSGVEPIPVSALSGSGSGDLLDAVLEALPETRPRRRRVGDVGDASSSSLAAETEATIADDEEFEEEEEEGGGGGHEQDSSSSKAREDRRSRRPLAVAIVGRPNAGKSSLLNAIAGGTRAIVSPVAGTTRDAVDAVVRGPPGSASDGVGSKLFRLVDTAGIRRRAAVSSSPTDAAEGLAVGRALSAMRRADVVALVVDAAACSRDGRFVATAQDFRLSEAIAQAGRACVIVLNKWDAVPNREPSTVATFEAEVRAQLRPVAWAPVVHASAASGRRVAKVLSAAAAAGEQHARRLPTATLNMVVRDAVTWRSPPGNRSSPKKGRVYYATQPSTRPPTFVLFVNDVSLFPEDYRRYVERSLRAAAGFAGTSLRVLWRGKPPRDPQQQQQQLRDPDGSFVGKSSVARAKRGKSGYGAKKGR